MSTIATKLKPSIQAVLNKYGTKVSIYRNTLNVYREPIGKELVCEIVGFYHEETSSSNTSTTEDGGEVKSSNEAYLMVGYDEVTTGIKDNDYFEMDGITYAVKDKINLNRLNIYFDMLLEVI